MPKKDAKPAEPQVFVCPPNVRCLCGCGLRAGGVCHHKWDGPFEESADGLESSVTCSKCGLWKMSHDAWLY